MKKLFFAVIFCLSLAVAFSKDYYICFASYLSRQSCEASQKKFADAGIQTFISQYRAKDNKVFYRLSFVQPFSSAKVATSQMRQFKTKFASRGLDMATSWICPMDKPHADSAQSHSDEDELSSPSEDEFSNLSNEETWNRDEADQNDLFAKSTKYRTLETPYSVLVVRYADFESARKKMRELLSNGYEAFIEISPDRLNCEVYVGAYKNEDLAREQIGKMTQAGYRNLNVAKFDLNEHTVVSEHYDQSPVDPYNIKFGITPLSVGDASNSEETKSGGASKTGTEPSAAKSDASSENNGALYEFLVKYFHNVPDPDVSKYEVAKFIVFEKMADKSEQTTLAASMELPHFLLLQNYNAFVKAVYRSKDKQKTANLTICSIQRDSLEDFAASQENEILNANGNVSNKTLTVTAPNGATNRIDCKLSVGEKTLLIGRLDAETLLVIEAENFSQENLDDLMTNTISF